MNVEVELFLHLELFSFTILKCPFPKLNLILFLIYNILDSASYDMNITEKHTLNHSTSKTLKTSTLKNQFVVAHSSRVGLLRLHGL